MGVRLSAWLTAKLVSLVKSEAEEIAFSRVAQTARPEEADDTPLSVSYDLARLWTLSSGSDRLWLSRGRRVDSTSAVIAAYEEISWRLQERHILKLDHQVFARLILIVLPR